MGCEFESTTVLPQWHVKDPGHSAKSAGGRLHLCTHAPLTQQSRIGLAMLLSRDNVGTYTENELTRNLSGNIRPRSSQLAEPHWAGPGIKSGISVRELISTLKKKKAQAGNGWSNILPKILASEENATTNNQSTTNVVSQRSTSRQIKNNSTGKIHFTIL